MIYADADFVFALTKEDDWLRDEAVEIYREHGGEIIVPLSTVIEVFMVIHRSDLDRERIAEGLIANLTLGFEDAVLAQAVELIEAGNTPFDAFHMAIAARDDRFDRIVTSDERFRDGPVPVVGMGQAAEPE